MGKICLTQVLKDLDGTPMRIEEPGLPLILAVSGADTLEDHHQDKYETKGQFLRLRKEFHKYMLLRSVITGALLHRVEEEDKSLSNEALMERVMLAQRVHEAEHFSFTAEQIVMLKKLINRRWAPASVLAVGRAFEMLEPKEEEKESVSGNGHIPESSVAAEASASR